MTPPDGAVDLDADAETPSAGDRHADPRAQVVERLLSSDLPLADGHDLAMLDLDGVVYVGGRAVAFAPEALDLLAATSMRRAFVTNNASRTPAGVADHLTDLGVPAEAADVVTSAQAAARLLAERLDPGARVLVVGGEGLLVALQDLGLVPVRHLDDDPVAVVQGYHPSLGWADLAEAAYAVQRGLLWVASNTDLTIPTARGVAPGNGTLVRAVATATGSSPLVAGKPEPGLFDETVRRVGTERPLVVGDRLDTDIEGANAIGAPSLLVMTGVSTLAELVNAPPRHRPTFLAPDLRGLLRPQLDETASDADEYDRATSLLRRTVSAAWAGDDVDLGPADAALRSLLGGPGGR